VNQAVNLQERGLSIPRGAGFLAALAGAGFLIWACGDGGAPSTPAPPAVTPAPPAAPPSLAWPVGGEEGLDWVINSYVDLDPGPGRRDYRGGDRTYNGHDGTDIYSPNFRWMDRDLPPVLAAAPGRVSIECRHSMRPLSMSIAIRWPRWGSLSGCTVLPRESQPVFA